MNQLLGFQLVPNGSFTFDYSPTLETIGSRKMSRMPLRQRRAGIPLWILCALSKRGRVIGYYQASNSVAPKNLWSINSLFWKITGLFSSSEALLHMPYLTSIDSLWTVQYFYCLEEQLEEWICFSSKFFIYHEGWQRRQPMHSNVRSIVQHSTFHWYKRDAAEAVFRTIMWETTRGGVLSTIFIDMISWSHDELNYISARTAKSNVLQHFH